MGWPRTSLGLCGLVFGERFTPAAGDPGESLVTRLAKSSAARLVQPESPTLHGLLRTATTTARVDAAVEPTILDVLAISSRQIAHLAKNVGARALEIGDRCAQGSGLAATLGSPAWRARAAGSVASAVDAAWTGVRQQRLEHHAEEHHGHHQAMSPLMAPAVRQIHALRGVIRDLGDHRKCAVKYPHPHSQMRVSMTCSDDFHSMNAFAE